LSTKVASVVTHASLTPNPNSCCLCYMGEAAVCFRFHGSLIVCVTWRGVLHPLINRVRRDLATALGLFATELRVTGARKSGT
jgi:hypothetical protein